MGYIEPQIISLSNICLLDGSWTSSAHFSRCVWVWIDSGGNIQLMGTRNFTRRESALHSEVEALRWVMENMLQHSTCHSFGTDCKELIAMIKEPHAWPSFATKLERIETLQICFPEFNITHVLRAHNQISDFLAKTARTFYRELHFIGCSIPIWLPRPPQVCNRMGVRRQKKLSLYNINYFKKYIYPFLKSNNIICRNTIFLTCKLRSYIILFYKVKID